MRAKADTGVVLGAMTLFAALVVFGAAVTRAALGVVGQGPLGTTVSTAVASQPVTDDSDAPDAGGTLAVVPAADEEVGTEVFPSHAAVVPAEVLSLAVERAPFDPDRQPPAQRYLLPDQIEPPRREQPPPERPAPPQFRILGTVAAPSGSVAVVRLADGATRILSVGQEMEGYRVNAIESGAVVMSGKGWDLTFAVADAQPGPGRPQRNEFGRIVQDSRGQQNRGQQNREQQGRGQSGSANERAAVVERVRFGDVQVEMMNNGRAVITEPNGARREIQIPVPPAGAIPPDMIFFRRPAPPGGR